MSMVATGQQSDLVEKILQVIRSTESGGNYQALNSSENPAVAASGAYQFISSTWRGVAQQSGVPNATSYARAVDAPPEIQDAVARWYVQSILDAHNGDTDSIWATWYTGHYDPNNIDYVPAGANSMTVRQYINTQKAKLDGSVLSGSGSSSSSGGTAQAAAIDPNTGLSTDPQVQAFLQAINADPDALVRNRFPAYALYLSDPELGPILRDAAFQNWDALKLQNAITSTNWWRTTSAAVRSWDQTVASDPASAQSQRDARILQISNEFANIGYAPDQATLVRIAEDSLRNGWDTNQLTNAVVNALPDTYQPGALTAGDLQTTMSGLRATASSYFMPVDDNTLYDWSKRVTAGTTNQQAFNTMMQGWAKSMFPWMSHQIDSGLTAQDFFAPLQQSVATIMGVSPDTIDIANDPTWNQLTRVSDGNGLTRAPTIADAQRLARTSTGYEGTVDFTNRAAQTQLALRQTFEGA